MTGWLQDLPPVRVVQLSGAMELGDSNASTVDSVRAAANVSGGSVSIFHAPFVLERAETAEALRRQPLVASGLAAANEVTHAVLAIGAWSPGNSALYDLVGQPTQDAIAAAGVIGESAGVFFDEQGCPVTVEATQRLITLSGQTLQAIPHVLAMAYGADKANAVSAAIHGRLITGLVTDMAIATALLEI